MTLPSRRPTEPAPAGSVGRGQRLDLAAYAAIATTSTPTLERVFRRISRAADYSNHSNRVMTAHPRSAQTARP